MKKLISREGPAVGTANERRLIEKAGGESTIAKSYQTNLDGTKTMAHTRGELSRPEVITTDPEPAKPLVDDGEWTYDYNPLRSAGGGLVPDLEGALPRNDPAKGAKTRRGGLKITSETECMLSVSKSSYDIHDKDKHRKMVRGPNYWYDKRNVVTWASEIEVDEAGDWSDYPRTNHVGVVQYEDATGLHEITIMSQQPWAAYNGGTAILCACLAKSADGRRYLRVAFINSGMLYVRDFRKGVLIATASWRHVGLTSHTGPVVDGLQIDGIRTGRNLAGFSQDGLRLVTAFDPDSLATAWRGNKCLVLTIPPPGESLSITPSIHAFSVPILDKLIPNRTVVGDWTSPGLPTNTGSLVGLAELTRTTVSTGAVETFDHDLAPFDSRLDHSSQQDVADDTAPDWFVGGLGDLFSGQESTRCEILALGFSKAGDVCSVIKSVDISGRSDFTRSKETNYRLWFSDVVDVTFSWVGAVPYVSTGSYPSREHETSTYEYSYIGNYSGASSQKYYFCSGASAINLDAIKDEETTNITFSELRSVNWSKEWSISYSDNSPAYASELKSGGSLVYTKNEYSCTQTLTVSETKFGSLTVSAADFIAGVIIVVKTPSSQLPGYVEHRSETGEVTYAPSDIPMGVSGYPDLNLGDGDPSVSIWRNAIQLAEKTVPSGTGVSYGDWWEKKKAFLAFTRDEADNFGGLLYKAGSWYNLVRNPNEPDGEFPHVPPNISHY